MPNTIKIKKGLNIPVEGEAPDSIVGQIKPDIVKVYPEDFAGLVPKVNVKVGDRVQAGSPLLHDKNNADIVFVSPVGGEVISVTRGEKRRLLDITVKTDAAVPAKEFEKKNPANLSKDEIKAALFESGLWPFIKQRPYDVVANPDVEPRDIFVTAFSTAPLAPSYDFIIGREPANLQTGLDALSKLTGGKVYLGVGTKTKLPAIREAKNVEIYEFDGPHPAGNVGLHINKIKPVNKGETVWTLNAPDVLFIGRLFNEGKVDLTRLVAYTGSEAVKKGYYSMVIGSSIQSLIDTNTTKGQPLRYISGNVLTGTKIEADGHLRYYDGQITVIPEGNETHEILGWALPGFQKFSAGSTYFSKLFGKRKYRFDARLLGGKRAIFMANEYEKVFPMDILPEYLIKATITFNIDKMEQLGIYEVAPEDFALCEFVDTSKLEVQKIIRAGLLQLKKEME
ncbi:MAG: Na(+)-translocating NADH-quinone reductase subunit A [Prevotella sp.]|jgi:Na+-transporting NADH:ubiquinone oxidoreductase subunit A|nr:Na(+)-translocating NADH-quinone reductase subunit A [Prevotella sp.]